MVQGNTERYNRSKRRHLHESAGQDDALLKPRPPVEQQRQPVRWDTAGPGAVPLEPGKLSSRGGWRSRWLGLGRGVAGVEARIRDEKQGVRAIDDVGSNIVGEDPPPAAPEKKKCLAVGRFTAKSREGGCRQVGDRAAAVG